VLKKPSSFQLSQFRQLTQLQLEMPSMEGWQPLWLRGVLYGKPSFGGRRLVRCVQLKLGRNRLCLIEKLLMLFSKQGVSEADSC
jgi:hypothetical protein